MKNALAAMRRYAEPFVYARPRSRGTTRIERIQDWTADLCYAISWWWINGVWSPPTRRWEKSGTRWPLPTCRHAARADR